MANANSTIKNNKNENSTSSEAKVKKEKVPELRQQNFIQNCIEKLVKSYRKINSMQVRVLSAIILIPVVITAVYINKVVFAILILATAILMAFEWTKITIAEEQNAIKWSIGGFFYILLPATSMILLRNLNNGANIVMWLLFVVWSTDTAGLFVGKAMEGPKLAPEISPNKTWSGLLGGIIASMLIGFLSSFILTPKHTLFLVIISGLLAIIEQASDLLESKIKRHFGIKDSGNLIPGHGGILDRVDGIILTAPIVLLIVLSNLNKFNFN